MPNGLKTTIKKVDLDKCLCCANYKCFSLFILLDVFVEHEHINKSFKCYISKFTFKE